MIKASIQVQGKILKPKVKNPQQYLVYLLNLRKYVMVKILWPIKNKNSIEMNS